MIKKLQPGMKVRYAGAASDGKVFTVGSIDERRLWAQLEHPTPNSMFPYEVAVQVDHIERAYEEVAEA